MKAEQPAEGILKRHDFGDSKFYSVACNCGNDDDALEFEVEADIMGVSVTTWTTQKTDWWTDTLEKRFDIHSPWQQEFDSFWKDLFNGFARRIKLTKQIWWDGHIKYQQTTIMTKQQALNYAETLKSAIKDVEHFQKQNTKRVENDQVMKAVNEQDCV
jgi:hypothetical protein